MNHGFSLYPINVNFQVVPGYDYGLRVTPNASGDFRIICNEFCGIGHHIMVGRVIVEDAPRPPRRQEPRDDCSSRQRRISRRRRRCRVPHLPGHRPSHPPRRRASDQGARGGLGRGAAHRRHRRGAAGAHALAGRAPAAGRVVLPHPRRARHEHADLLHHLLRDGGAVLRQHRAPQRAQLRAEDLAGPASR